jgi:DNA invertase Pin-like site-specific DNA recombinase
MHVAIYARVSTERQERQQTIDSQLAALRAWAAGGDHDLDEAHVFRDEGYSGRVSTDPASMPCATRSATEPSSTSRC